MRHDPDPSRRVLQSWQRDRERDVEHVRFRGEYSVSERFAIRSEIEWIDSDSSGAVRMVSLGGVFRFR